MAADHITDALENSRYGGSADEYLLVGFGGDVKHFGETPPPDAMIVGETAELRKRLADAADVLANSPALEYNVENPVQAMRMYAVSLETGIDRKMPLPARTLQQMDAIINDLGAAGKDSSLGGRFVLEWSACSDCSTGFVFGKTG